MITSTMLPLKSIAEAQEYLLRYSPPKMSGESYTLGRMQKLMKRLGDPQNSLRVIHVAGTSGKTSTSYFIRSLLEASGARTGLTASPHITSITERVQIDGAPLQDDKFLDYLNYFLKEIDVWQDIEPTYFELLIAFAYWVFAREKIEYAIVEVGLGGLLDATNVISRKDKICVITPIGLDHTHILGNTTELIAKQKAGIVNAHNAVFSAKQDEKVKSVIYEAVETQDGRLHEVLATDEQSHLPEFQQQNFTLAQAVVDFVAKRDDLSALTTAQIKACTYHTPPGRFEVYRKGEKTIFLDGAHNPQKLNALMGALEKKGITPDSACWLIGFISAPDEKISDCLNVVIEAKPAQIIATQFSVGQDIKGRQSVSADTLAEFVGRYSVDVHIQTSPKKALTLAVSGPESVVIITGSLYLVAQLRKQLTQ